MVFAAILAAPAVLSGGDLYWHIAAGRWMIENQAVLRIDTFSYTVAGQAWETRDWLAELLLALSYVGAGWSGIVALSAAAAAGAAGLLAFALRRGCSDGLTAIWLGLAFVAGAGAVRALPYLIALPCMVAWLGWLVRARAQERSPPLGLLPVMLLWANLSASFVIGLGLVFALAAEAVVMAQGSRLRALRAWGLFAACSLGLSLVTPTGAPGLVHAVRALMAPAPIDSVWPLLVALPAASVLLPQRKMLLRVVFLAGLFVLALTSALGRLFFAAAAPLLAIGPTKGEEPLPFRLRPLAALVILVIAATGLRLLVPVIRADDHASPGAALAHVPTPLRRQAVLNEVGFGGFLIFNDVKPFIDSRPLYSPSFRARAAGLADPNLLTNTLTRYHIRWTILSPANPAAAAMDGIAGWHRLYRDQWAVVHVKNGTRY
jgi:hypothetical protein